MKKGFTLVELVIVITVIGILASISVVGYGKWRESTAQKVVQSDLQMVAAGMKSARNFSKSYPILAAGSTFDTTGPMANTQIFKSSPDVTLTYIAGDSKQYCVEGVSIKQPSVRFYISPTLSNDKPTSGSCPVSSTIPLPTVVGASSASINITWPAVSGASSYSVKYGPSSPTITASCVNSPCSISGLASSTIYYVTVTAVGSWGSTTSATVSATTKTIEYEYTGICNWYSANTGNSGSYVETVWAVSMPSAPSACAQSEQSDGTVSSWTATGNRRDKS